MPCTPEMLDKAIECASEFKLVSFTASPTSVSPGQPVTLRWNINRTGQCNAQFKINGVAVPINGTKVVNPIVDNTYALSLHTTCNISRNLGRIAVDVNDSTCRITSIAESLVRNEIIRAVDASIQEFNQSSSNDLSKRIQTQVEIDSTGITVRLRLSAVINNFPDPEINVDMTVGAGVGPGNTVTVFYRSFSIDVDLPWWVTSISLGITKIVEEIVEGRIEGNIKGKILNSLRAKLTAAAKLIPGVLTHIQTLQDELRLRIC